MQFDSLKIIAAEAEATEAIEVVAEVIDLIPTGTLVDSTTTGLAEAALDTQTMKGLTSQFSLRHPSSQSKSSW